MAWSYSANIKGASGASGATGPQGASGASGPVGATGASGASGPAGTTTWSGITDKPAVIAAGVDAAAARNVISAEYTGNKGAANGYAALDSSGLVPSSQLPSFVDDIVEGANLATFPATGETGKIYTALDTNKVYRWGGSSYTEISPSPGSTDAVPEGSTNLYYTAARADGRISAAVGSTVQAYSATLTTYAGKTAPTGTVVGTTDTQALTNKDLSGAGNTFPAFIKRNVSTVTSNGTLGSAANTDYVVFSNVSTTDAEVTALLHLDGSNGSTTITDSSTLAANWTANGNAALSTSVKKFGTASVALDGNRDYLTPTASTTNFTFGTGAFTIECQFYCTSLAVANVVFDWRPSNTEGFYPNVVVNSDGTIQWYINSSARISSSSGAVTTNTWYHIAVSRSGTSTRLFLNGTQVGSTWTDSSDYICGSGRPFFGANGGVAFGDAVGYMDEIRITKGVARYTANFTAPTAAFTDPETPKLTLPTAVGSTNLYTVRNIHASTSVVLNTTSSQTIDGSSTLSLATNAKTTLCSDGSNWRTIT